MPQFYPRKQLVPIRPGYTLAHKPGRGYYAKPGGPLAPLSPAEIHRQADTRLAGIIDPQRQEIERQRQLASERALRDQQAMRDLGVTLADILRQSAPGMQAGYKQAGEAVSGLAGGYSQAAAERMRAVQAEREAAVAALAPGSAPSDAPSADSLQDALYALGGAIPGESLFAQGAAARRFGESLPAIEALRTQGAVRGAQRQAAEVDDEYAAELIQLAAKRPELRAQIVEELRKLELEKLQAAIQEREMRVRESAQKLYESQFGAEQEERDFQRRYKVAQLSFDQKRHADALREQMAKGSKPNASLSKVYGYVVDANGRPILDGKGRKIPVTKSTGAKTPAERQAADKAKAFKAADSAGDKALKQFAQGIRRNVVKTGNYFSDEIDAEVNRRVNMNYDRAVDAVTEAMSEQASGLPASEIRKRAVALVERLYGKRGEWRGK
jgi:hypothetical protein